MTLVLPTLLQKQVVPLSADFVQLMEHSVNVHDLRSSGTVYHSFFEIGMLPVFLRVVHFIFVTAIINVFKEQSSHDALTEKSFLLLFREVLLESRVMHEGKALLEGVVC